MAPPEHKPTKYPPMRDDREGGRRPEFPQRKREGWPGERGDRSADSLHAHACSISHVFDEQILPPMPCASCSLQECMHARAGLMGRASASICCGPMYCEDARASVKAFAVWRWLHCCHTGQEDPRTLTGEETCLCMVAWDIGMATGACLHVNASVTPASAKVCNSALRCDNGLIVSESLAVDVLRQPLWWC